MPRSVPLISTESNYVSPDLSHGQQSSWSGYSVDQQTRQAPQAQQTAETETETDNAKMTVRESIAAADIQNPSDALEFLAHVADRAEGRMLPPIRTGLYPNSPSQHSSTISGQTSTPPASAGQFSAGSIIDYPPLQKGQINVETLHELLAR